MTYLAPALKKVGAFLFSQPKEDKPLKSFRNNAHRTVFLEVSRNMNRSNYRKDHCKSQSEFIERAIQYYVGRVNAEDDTSYLPNAFLSNMRAIASESDNRVSRMLFKLTVELAMVMNLIAANYEIDPETLERLRGSCVREVKRLGGSFSMEDAVDWQNG